MQDREHAYTPIMPDLLEWQCSYIAHCRPLVECRLPVRQIVKRFAGGCISAMLCPQEAKHEGLAIMFDRPCTERLPIDKTKKLRIAAPA